MVSTKVLWSAGIATSAILAATALVASTAMPPSTDKALAAASAGSGESYLLSRFSFKYPDDDPRQAVGPDPSRANVGFFIRWTGERYPGKATCGLSVFDAAGREIGHLAFELDSATNRTEAIPMRVEVSAPPVSGEGSCGEAFYPPGPGYDFGAPVSMERATEGRYSARGSGKDVATELVFEVRVTSDSAPGLRACELLVTRKNGTQDRPNRFNYNGGNGEMSLLVPGRPATIETAAVNCRPFRR